MPATKPPMCAQNATGSSGIPTAPSNPDATCSINQSPNSTSAGKSTIRINKKNTSVRTFAVGNVMAYPPSTAATAPLAPTTGMSDCGPDDPKHERRHHAPQQIEREIHEMPQAIFNVVAEDPQHPHIHQQMHPPAVQEHRREKRDDKRPQAFVDNCITPICTGRARRPSTGETLGRRVRLPWPTCDSRAGTNPYSHRDLRLLASGSDHIQPVTTKFAAMISSVTSGNRLCGFKSKSGKSMANHHRP